MTAFLYVNHIVNTVYTNVTLFCTLQPYRELHEIENTKDTRPYNNNNFTVFIVLSVSSRSSAHVSGVTVEFENVTHFLKT